MPTRRPHVTASAAQSELAIALAELRRAMELPERFPADADAEASATLAPTPPPAADAREIPFVTIDPPGSSDLDQALHLERRDGGFLVRYAIADVPGWVRAGAAVDREARLRGQTLYAADGRVPLHPPVLSEDRVSLLPGAERSAFVWEFDLDERGEVLATRLARSLVRSREQLSYDEAQARLDAGDPLFGLLREVGLARIELERARGGASLNTPDEEIVGTADGGYTIERRSPLPVEEWNAQLSLMTGMEAARLMLAGRIGVLRTMPKPGADELAEFRRQTVALGRPWPEGVAYGDYLRGLDRADPAALAVMQAASALFRGAGYLVIDGEVPADPTQSAVAAPYAHVTAPLRRLVDRWGLVVCEALCAGHEVPRWARDSLGELPALMNSSSQRASRLAADSIARVEAALLSTRVGERFPATVLTLRGERLVFQLAEPAVTASCPAPGGVEAGTSIEVELLSAEIASGEVAFRAVAAQA